MDTEIRGFTYYDSAFDEYVDGFAGYREGKRITEGYETREEVRSEITRLDPRTHTPSSPSPSRAGEGDS